MPIKIKDKKAKEALLYDNIHIDRVEITGRRRGESGVSVYDWRVHYTEYAINKKGKHVFGRQKTFNSQNYDSLDFEKDVIDLIQTHENLKLKRS